MGVRELIVGRSCDNRCLQGWDGLAVQNAAQRAGCEYVGLSARDRVGLHRFGLELRHGVELERARQQGPPTQVVVVELLGQRPNVEAGT